MKTLEYRKVFGLDGAPLEKKRFNEFMIKFAEEFNDSYSRVNLKTASQLKSFVSTFKQKYNDILADTYDIDVYSESYDKLWNWFYFENVVPKFKPKEEKKGATK